MRTVLVGVGFALLQSGCASTPQKTTGQLDMKDPKFSSAECSDIRARSLTYDDKVGQRALTGMALGLFLGPLGLPMAAAVDAKQNEEREAFNREITIRCVTGGEAIVAAQDMKKREMVATAIATRNDTNAPQ